MISLPATPLAALVCAVHASADHDPRAEAAPSAVLWCDPGREFAPLLPALRTALPSLLTLGPIDPALRQGPAIWLRTAAGRALPAVDWPGDAPPVIYVPGVGREVLRAAEDCPEPLRLLAFYAVTGAVFGHPNARDWTLRGFLAANAAYGGLGLDVPGDEPTRQALAAAAAKLFARPLAELQGRRLDATWLHHLLAPDLAEDTLAWMGGELTAQADPPRFAAFQARAKAELKLDPARTPLAAAAARVLRQDAGWAPVWTRFATAGPGFHEPVAALLTAVESPDPLLADPAVYATANARQENELRSALLRLDGATEATARETVTRLAKIHAPRAAGPWAARGHARLAAAIVQIARLAASPALPSQDAVSLAAAYAASGWQADDAAMQALAAVAPGAGHLDSLAADRAGVALTLRALYAPRLAREAETLQALLPQGPPRSPAPAETEAVLFVDGLRMDLAHRLSALLHRAGATVEVGWRWTGFPSVTATCKPLASPAAPRLHGGDDAETFEPLAADGRRATTPVLLREMEAAGYGAALTLNPRDRCWLEAGHFDKDGHDQQSRLADGLEAGLMAVAAEALTIIRSGRRLRVTTDHGWLLLPGGLPVARLPAGLTATRWRRCAVVHEGAATNVARLPWTWNPAVLVATAPGIHVFMDGADYAHGGISPQESVVPELLIAPLAPARRAVTLAVKWIGLRLYVTAEGGEGLTAFLLLGPEGQGVPAAAPKTLKPDGTASLPADDAFVGQVALLELRDQSGQVLASQRVVVGG